MKTGLKLKKTEESLFLATIYQISIAQKLYEIDNLHQHWMPFVLLILQTSDSSLVDVEKMMNFPISYFGGLSKRNRKLWSMIEGAKSRSSDSKVRSFGRKRLAPKRLTKILSPIEHHI